MSTPPGLPSETNKFKLQAAREDRLIIRKRGAPLEYWPKDGYESPVFPAVAKRIPSLQLALAQHEREKSKQGGKRNASESSKPSMESVLGQRAKAKKESKNMMEYDAWKLKQVDSIVTAKIANIKSDIEKFDIVLKEIIVAREKGQIKDHDFQDARDNVNELRSAAQTQLIIAKRKKGTLTGIIYDAIDDPTAIPDSDLGLLLQKYAIEPAGATIHLAPLGTGKRDQTMQLNFRDAVPHYYNALHPKMRDNALWCPISHDWKDGRLVKRVHIVPHSILEVNAQYIFGRKDDCVGHLFDRRNGLLMHANFEEAFEMAQIAIVPTDANDRSCVDFKVVVLDPEVLNRPDFIGFSWRDIDNRPLQFRSANRPARRYLYFTFLIALFRRRRHKCAGWERDEALIKCRKMWHTPGKWLHNSTMRALARRMGFVEDLEDFLDSPETGLAPPDENEQEDIELICASVEEGYNLAEKKHNHQEDLEDDSEAD
jgi:hypothetical protein